MPKRDPLLSTKLHPDQAAAPLPDSLGWAIGLENQVDGKQERVDDERKREVDEWKEHHRHKDKA